MVQTYFFNTTIFLRPFMLVISNFLLVKPVGNKSVKTMIRTLATQVKGNTILDTNI